MHFDYLLSVVEQTDVVVRPSKWKKGWGDFWPLRIFFPVKESRVRQFCVGGRSIFLVRFNPTFVGQYWTASFGWGQSLLIWTLKSKIIPKPYRTPKWWGTLFSLWEIGILWGVGSTSIRRTR
jgi:hypothetical protein